MIDPVGAAIEGLQRQDLRLLPMMAAAGAITSLGPCVAPRYVALAALVQRGHRVRITGAFVAGLVTAYLLLGAAGAAVALVAANADLLNAALAVVLVAFGLRSVLARPRRCEQRAPGSPRLGGAFLLGAASALVVSPCCAPIVAIAAGLAATGGPLVGLPFLLAFALGHALPLVFATVGGTPGRSGVDRWIASGAPAVISGSLMIALGAYYGLQVV